MELKIEARPDVLIIAPQLERLDALASAEFRREVLQHLGNHRRVVLDMSRVSFVDSSGLASLVSLLKSLPDGATLRLAHVHANVQALLRLTRLMKVFSSFPTVEEALAA
jgi:anti-sigma B factor antagonist